MIIIMVIIYNDILVHDPSAQCCFAASALIGHPGWEKLISFSVRQLNLLHASGFQDFMEVLFYHTFPPSPPFRSHAP